MLKELQYKYKIVSKNGKYGATLFGAVIIPFEYQELRAFNKNDMAIAKKKNKYGAINSKNEVVIPFELDDVSFFMGGSINSGKEWEEWSVRFARKTFDSL